MGANSKIEWTHHTFNPWWGCQKVSDGCKNCYAENLDKRFKGGHWGPDSPRKMMSDKHWRGPLKWNAEAANAGERRRVFCASMADIFEDNEQLIAPRERLWDLIRATARLDWLLLTKRPENFVRMLPWSHRANGYDGGTQDPAWDNVWLGVTAEHQETADLRIPLLLGVPAKRHFVSYEPALGPLDLLDNWIVKDRSRWVFGDARVDWLIAGAESGARHRRMDEDWVRSVRDQCVDAGVSFFYKQKVIDKLKLSLPSIDGRQWAQIPGVMDNGRKN